MDGWHWILSRPDEVMERDHPDYEYWQEAADIERWIAEGAHPPADTAEPPEGEAPPTPPHLCLAVTKAQAGELLGGKSVDWIEKHVLPHVATLRPSRSVLIPTSELERWVSENSGLAL